MSDASNPFEQMMRQMQDMAKTMGPAMDAFSPKSFEAMWQTMPKDLMEMTFGKGLNPDGLDAKTRLLLTLAGLTMQGAQADSAVRLTVRHAREAGATDAEIAETIAQMGMFAGVPATTRAIALAREVMDGDKEEGKDT
ncbi:carboxymuconolactone decarboxylase family protein [Roseovarius nanhaiticus]|uniref:4-carboxymuconolactone decarboxylase n=1 Tax=Roseovarius nanhaiticus TaxID=573024 RepID=A0A1N7HEW5_9RHOB|nr:carboxymuconolactone decarboxylase family protein [Roseovarius nanhaiticus]SEK99076.1 4-carboxymuconolactone decarboxylase [Roseovarius nanhaiticus]SIS23372.1 4-carboxymuconolactone decarboxylase [Roseovarius nanhaiticus]